VVKSASDKTESGDTFVGKLSRDSKLRLTAVKTSLNPDFVQLTRPDIVILMAAKHQFIVELLPHRTDIRRL
jgi:hypothetical protein